MTYIATFHTHFAAVSFARELKATPEMKPQFMPVPRKLSSSCGTCVRYEADAVPSEQEIPNEVEQIVALEENGYRTLYRSRNS